MDTVRIPHSDLVLSRIGLGCWTFGGTYWGDDIDDARSIRTIHAALDVGINWVDTAPLYGPERSDHIVATALSGRPAVQIATKVGVRTHGTASGHAESDLHPAHLRADTEASLRRLRRDTLDLLQVHWPCEHDTPLEDTVGTLEDLRDEGKIRAWGVCNYEAEALRRIRSLGRLSTLQTPYSLLRREFSSSLEAEVLSPDSSGQPAATLAYETLVRGLLTGRYRSLPTFPDTDQRSWDERFAGRRFAHARALTDDLQQVADKLGTSVPAVAVAWVLSRPAISAAIVGARSPAQVVATAEAATLAHRARAMTVVDRIAALHGGT